MTIKSVVFTPLLHRLLLGFVLLAAPSALWAETLTLGSLSDTPSEEFAVFLPFAQYLASELKGQGIDNARVEVRRTHAEMAELMKAGEVDLFIDSSLSALKVQRLCGGDFLARRWKKGVSEYHSVVFVRAASPVQGLADLAGRSIAFEEPFSSSGYLLPAGEIHQAGLSLVPDEQKPPAGAVRFRFSNADENTLLWVLRGKTDAGAMAANRMTKLSAPVAGELRVVHSSRIIPYHVVVHRPGLADTLRIAIHERLLAMEHDQAGLRTLRVFEETTRFDDIPPEVLRNLRAVPLGF